MTASCDLYPAPENGYPRPALNQLDALILNGVQLILAEKRTSLSVLRTGIAVFALPLTIFSVLIALSKFYNALDNLHFIIPVGLINSALLILASYLTHTVTFKDGSLRPTNRRTEASPPFFTYIY
ncbi:MAG: hypothetical protein ACI9KN_001983 [Gammaproteobacteria bacterium]|jgi:hypothetical protein